MKFTVGQKVKCTNLPDWETGLVIGCVYTLSSIAQWSQIVGAFTLEERGDSLFSSCWFAAAQPELNLITMTDTYRTTDGRDVRILAIDGPTPRPVVGVVGEKIVHTWTKYGHNASAYSLNLVKMKRRYKTTRYYAIRKGGAAPSVTNPDALGIASNMTMEEAKASVVNARNSPYPVIAIVPVTFDVTEGEGL